MSSERAVFNIWCTQNSRKREESMSEQLVPRGFVTEVNEEVREVGWINGRALPCTVKAL